jgi:hypothetical protein
MGSARTQNEFSVMRNRNFYFIMSRYIFLHLSCTHDSFECKPAHSLVFTSATNPSDLVDKLTEILEKYEFSWQTDYEIHDPYDAPEAARALVSQIHDWSDEKGKWLSECDRKSFDSEDLTDPPRNDVYLWPNFQFIVTDEKYIYHL